VNCDDGNLVEAEVGDELASAQNHAADEGELVVMRAMKQPQKRIWS
jgi:hypothetical protein